MQVAGRLANRGATAVGVRWLSLSGFGHSQDPASQDSYFVHIRLSAVDPLCVGKRAALLTAAVLSGDI